MSRRYYKNRRKSGIKQTIKWLLIGGSIIYVALTGCNKPYKPIPAEAPTRTRVDSSSRPHQQPRETHEPITTRYWWHAVRDGTYTQQPPMALSKKDKWRVKMSEQIIERDDIPSDLERLAINYVPQGFYPKIGDKFYRDHKQYCIDLFLKRYKHHRVKGCDEELAKIHGVYDTVKTVLQLREEAYS